MKIKFCGAASGVTGSNRLVRVFGDEILDEEGCLKRKVLGEKVRNKYKFSRKN